MLKGDYGHWTYEMQAEWRAKYDQDEADAAEAAKLEAGAGQTGEGN